MRVTTELLRGWVRPASVKMRPVMWRASDTLTLCYGGYKNKRNLAKKRYRIFENIFLGFPKREHGTQKSWGLVCRINNLAPRPSTECGNSRLAHQKGEPGATGRRRAAVTRRKMGSWEKITVPAKLTPALPRTECTPESRMQFSSNLPLRNRTLLAFDAPFAARSSGSERRCLVALSSVLANRLPTSQQLSD